MTHRREDQNDALARLTDAFAGMVVPEGPAGDVKQQLKSELERQSGGSSVVSNRGPGSVWTMQRVMSVAAMIAVIASIGGLALTRAGSGSVFAAMVDRVIAVQSARFQARNEIKDKDSATVMESTFTVAKPWRRVEFTLDGQKSVRITNTDENKSLTLFEGSKTARLESGRGDKLKDIVAKIGSLPKEGAEDLGHETLDGVDAKKYRYGHNGDYYTLWIDPATNLPLQIVATNTADPAAATITSTYSHFEWNVPFEPAKFSLEVPSGYEVSPNDE